MKADNSPSAIGVWSVPVELLNDSSVFMGLSPLQIYCAAMIAAGCNERITSETSGRNNWTMVLAIPWHQSMQPALVDAVQQSRDLRGEPRPRSSPLANLDLSIEAGDPLTPILQANRLLRALPSQDRTIP
jgi:hypothetical protein